jgi:CheY-like chemotaxis protein
VQVAERGADAIAACAERVFDAITLDLLLPDMTGLDVLHQVRLNGRNRDTPVIVVSVVADRGIVGGFSVHDYLGKPMDGKELIGSLQRAGVYPRDDGSILVVDDDDAALRLMETCLSKLGFHAVCCLDGQSALDAARERPPLAVIVDLLMPGMDGFGFLARFRQMPTNRRIPVIVWTMKDLTEEDHVRLRDLATAVVVKQNHEPTKLVEELRSLLTTDRLG